MAERALRVLLELVACAVFPALLIGPAILAWQALQWLQFGQWPAVFTSDALTTLGIDYPHTRLLGVQKIIDVWPQLKLFRFGDC